MPRRRKLRPPVLSRLALAWGCAFVILAGAAGYFIHAANSGEGAQRIALPVDAVERLARAPGSEERIAAPVAQNEPADAPDKPEMMAGEDAEDSLELIYPGANDFFAENQDAPGEDDENVASGDIVITIPGGKKKEATAPRAASLTPHVRPIPDADAALLRTTALGRTPRIAPDGRKALRYYARPFDGDRSLPRIAVIVGGLGLNATVTERAIDDLPPEVSLSFAPYAKNLDFWTKKARQAGHEVLIELPMEGYGANVKALGAAALLTSRSEAENLQRLDWLMARFGAYFAATNYLGAKFSADADAIAPVLKRLREAGVGYIDDTGAAGRAGAETGLAMASVSRMIPAAADDADLRAVERELRQLEKIAERDGQALGKTYAYAATIEALAEWTRTLERKGFEKAPASALLRTAAASR
ncbi:divergent polysaccharide deacetylase family protein [Hyphococcus luteus]|uniref:Divergent polysaccharide deacetylase family protein n=1 Tax=Hyphococcus luteus TaxID=2058213 RepID=A0A2S7K6I4_9PROT|nr:divergent polysaccharide deacetylase family protein [Marinicaulis flavus]PQA88086.1 hypothetical protein CW354_07105 [Marinicaulis flavus]